MKVDTKIGLLLTVILLSCASLFFSYVCASALDVTFEWNANTEHDLDHYVVYWGTSSGGPYPEKSSDIPKDTTTYQLTSLAENTKHYFVVRAVDNQGNESADGEEICAIKRVPPDAEGRDAEWEITSGNFKGVKFVFDSSGDTPSLGPTGEIPAIPGVNGVGLALNLQPSGVPFNPPVKILVPSPGYSDVSRLNVYYYDDAMMDWFLANDANEPDVVQPSAQGWMVPNSRVNHNNGNPSAIEIQVEHFSGAQAGTPSGASGSGGGGGGGCFISTAAFKSKEEGRWKDGILERWNIGVLGSKSR